MRAIANSHNSVQHALNGNTSPGDTPPFSEIDNMNNILKKLWEQYNHVPYVVTGRTQQAVDIVQQSESEWITTERVVPHQDPMMCGELCGTCYTYLGQVRAQADTVTVGPHVGNGHIDAAAVQAAVYELRGGRAVIQAAVAAHRNTRRELFQERRQVQYAGQGDAAVAAVIPDKDAGQAQNDDAGAQQADIEVPAKQVLEEDRAAAARAEQRRTDNIQRILRKALRAHITENGQQAHVPRGRMGPLIEEGFVGAQGHVPDALRQNIQQYQRDANLWVGVGTSSKITGPDITALFRGMLNPRYGLDSAIWFTGSATFDNIRNYQLSIKSRDWRLQALKVALYDTMVERIHMQPAGVQYDVATTVPALSYRVSRRDMDQWGYTAVAITPQLLERAMQCHYLIIAGQKHDLSLSSDSRMTVIVLNPEHNTSIRIGLKILASLEYPLAQAIDIYKMVDGQRDVEFIRNASNVTIHDARRIIVFVIPSVTSVRREGVDIGPLHVIPLDDPGYNQPLPNLAPFPFDDALVDIVHSTLQPGFLLKAEWTSMLRLINGDKDLDWSEISKIMVHLIPRFPPQAEQTRQGGVNNVPHTVASVHCPAAFVNLDPNDNGFPGEVHALQLAGENAGYYHTRVVNAMDLVTVDRRNADMCPVIRVGAWSNVVEICVGMGTFYLDTSTSSAYADKSDFAYESTRSLLFKARALRGICEIIKNMGALGDATVAVADGTLDIDNYKWQMEVNDSRFGLLNIAQRTISEETGSSGLGVTYSLGANLMRKDCRPSLTGYRSSALADVGLDSCNLASDGWFEKIYVHYNSRCTTPALFDSWVPEGVNIPDVTTRRRLGRVNTAVLPSVRPFIDCDRKTPIPLNDSILASRIHSGFTNRLMEVAGWGALGRVRVGNRSPVFGWGLTAFLRLWERRVDVIVPVDDLVRNVFIDGSYVDPLQIITSRAMPQPSPFYLQSMMAIIKELDRNAQNEV